MHTYVVWEDLQHVNVLKNKIRRGRERVYKVFVLGIMLFNCVCLARISLEILLNPSTGCSLLNLLQNTVPRISFIRLCLLTSPRQWRVLQIRYGNGGSRRFMGIFAYKHPCKYVQ